MKKATKIRLLKVGMFVSGALTIMLALSDFIIKQLIKLMLKADVEVEGASSIGIIGGADGPTAVFIATNELFAFKYIWMLIFLVIMGACFLLWRKVSKLS
ncbi:hypothetical protein [Geosporobacter ferrireducens]|nr:hypothetical protein [Geosporobacter ferrireducens]MTI55618.1 sodium ion-translocating decarboxylase subunit beta [Geosporobacter ferrireducens]